jgi:hypothetical protein
MASERSFHLKTPSFHPTVRPAIPVRVLAPKQKSTFKYVGTLTRYNEASLHTQFVAGGAQVGKVEISARKWISKSASPVPSAYQGCLQ